jgi:hypothetical protein
MMVFGAIVWSIHDQRRTVEESRMMVERELVYLLDLVDGGVVFNAHLVQ